MVNLKSGFIQTSINGKYIIQKSDNRLASPLLIGFHGYGQTAEQQLQMLQKIPGINHWICCSIQALHPFYNSKGQIGYNWMTSEDRELRIRENILYVNNIIKEIFKNYAINETIVYHGFSQGTAMACRSAMLGEYQSHGVILLGGDIPPEMDNIDRMKRVLIARGNKDPFYSTIRWEKDIQKVKSAKIESTVFNFEGGHEGAQEYYNAVGEFLKTIKI